MEDEKVIQDQSTEIQENVQPEPNIQPQNSVLESNIRSLREAKEQAERNNIELQNRIRDYEQKMNPVVEDDITYNFNIGDDDLPEGKHLKGMYEHTQKNFAKQKKEIESLKKQTENIYVETRIRNEFPDYDKVVSPENIKLLSEQYPDVAMSLHTSTDNFSKNKAAYQIIKKLGIGTEDTYARDKEIAQKNAAKPRPAAAISPTRGDSPIDMADMFANGLTADVKAAIREKVQQNKKKR